MKKWSRKHDCCISCGGTQNKHVGNGLCKKCYNKNWKQEHQEYFRVYNKEYNKTYYQNNKNRLREHNIENSKEWRKNNQQHVKEYSKDYRLVNKERIKKQGKEYRKHNQEVKRRYYQSNKKRAQEWGKKYYQENKEYIKERIEKWRQGNREMVRATASHRRSLKRGAKGSHTGEERELLFKLSNYKCLSCGTKENLEIDHIRPLSKGGRDDIINLQVLCKSCNCVKHNSNSTDYRSAGFKQSISAYLKQDKT